MSDRLLRPTRILTLAAVLAACLALPALASATSFTVKWSRSALLLNPNRGYALDSVTCAPSVTSNAVSRLTAPTTTAPGAPTATATSTPTNASSTATATAAAATTTTRKRAPVTTTAVYTSSGARVVNRSLLCLAGDNKGGIWASIHPGRGRRSWHRERVDTAAGGIAITGVACPALNLCVAVDAHGQVMHSTSPDIAAKYWTKPRRVDAATQPGGGFVGFSAIACPSTQLCIAVDNAVNGQVAYTTDPAGPARDWKIATIGTGVTLDSVACATVNLCVLGGSQRYYSTNPAGGATAWTAIGTLAGNSSMLASLSCTTVKLCVGVGYGNAGTGLASASSTMATSGGTWTGSYVGFDPPAQATGLLDSVACPARNFCVAVDGASNAYTSSTPVRGNWVGPVALKKNSTAAYSALSCNATVCVEVDNRGTATYGAVKNSAPTPPATKSTTSTATKSTASTTTESTATGSTTATTTPANG